MRFTLDSTPATKSTKVQNVLFIYLFFCSDLHTASPLSPGVPSSPGAP